MLFTNNKILLRIQKNSFFYFYKNNYSKKKNNVQISI